MLKELKAAFKTKTAVQAFAAAPSEPSERMQTLGPQLETFTAGVVKKYGFEGGFNEAMQSIAAVGGKEQDEKIRTLIVSSWPPPRNYRSMRLADLSGAERGVCRRTWGRSSPEKRALASSRPKTKSSKPSWLHARRVNEADRVGKSDRFTVLRQL